MIQFSFDFSFSEYYDDMFKWYHGIIAKGYGKILMIEIFWFR